MARCNLEISHPKFAAVVANDPDLQAGLEELRNKVAKDTKLAHGVNHPMPGFPAYQNKVLKFDWAPASIHSSTRPGWRLYAYVENATGPAPIRAIPFLIHPRSEAPKGNPALYVAQSLKKFLTDNVTVEAEEEKFKHQTMMDGSTRSMCYTCWETVAVSADEAEIAVAESAHQCDERR